jgi:hypothetical protein
MAARRHSTFNKIKATCDELEITAMMRFKYYWNKEIICQFYATLYFDTNGQRLLWMTDGNRCVITVREFARMLGLEHQLTMETMFAWCCDTSQCQDVILSNKRCQNEKMGIDVFDEFPLPVPPLDDDPFYSLSAVDIAAIEAAPDDDEASGSEYEDEEEGKDDDK